MWSITFVYPWIYYNSRYKVQQLYSYPRINCRYICVMYINCTWILITLNCLNKIICIYLRIMLRHIFWFFFLFQFTMLLADYKKVQTLWYEQQWNSKECKKKTEGTIDCKVIVWTILEEYLKIVKIQKLLETIENFQSKTNLFWNQWPDNSQWNFSYI